MYKIILNNSVIDIVRKPRFIKILSSGNVAITDKTSANGIVGSDGMTVYSLVEGLNTDAKVVTIREIEQDEFSRLECLLNSGDTIIDNGEELNKAVENTIENLSHMCKHKITSGFSTVLSDGNVYKFRLTPEDQINLLNLENQLRTDDSLFVYHSTGMPCKVFKREDVNKIVKQYRKHVLYHTTYFNVAKQYVASLKDVNKIKEFHYGTDITDFTNDIAIKQILIQGAYNR